jgi:hypothetical protein
VRHARRLLVCALAASSAGSACSGDHGGGGGDASIAADTGTSPSDAGAHASDASNPGEDGAPLDSAADSITDAGSDASPYRDPLVQPFASSSIWNTPIGSAARYVPAQIAPITGNTLRGDADLIVLTPTAPSTPIYRNTADWNPDVSRCPYDAGPLIYAVPLPADFVFGDTPTSSTPNAGLAALLSDGRTIKQNQPFARCSAGVPATSDYTAPDVDLYGDGIPGAHGGSGLSAIGGTLRVGELRPSAAPPHHVLKLELYAAQNYYNDGNQADCYRWPASGCDGYFDDSSSPLEYGGKNPALRPGSLLALPTSVTIAGLNRPTQPAQMLAWTLQNYGAYLVDDTAYSTVNICVETGPAGSFVSQFQSDWGYSIETSGTTGAFAQDMTAIYAALAVVDDNTSTTIGGGGTPLQPLALPLPPVTPADQ